jgi:hypothetical protein
MKKLMSEYVAREVRALSHMEMPAEAIDAAASH